MKIWISVDMEGVAGIVDWDQCRPAGGARYDVGCRLMLAEVNAAVEGAMAGGATEVVVNDSHGTMANLDPGALAGEARYIAGRHKPLYMMQGLDETFDAVSLFRRLPRLDLRPALDAVAHLQPEVFAAARGQRRAGRRERDQRAGRRAPRGADRLRLRRRGDPGRDRAVRRGGGLGRDQGVDHRFSADNLHPAQSCRLIREGAERAVRAVAAGAVPTPGIARPATLELDVQTGDMAEVATWARGVERTG